jgi:4'-phosphopantetheinyl transferase
MYLKTNMNSTPENIASNEIHLWFSQDNGIDDPALLEMYHQFLNSQESEQQARFHFAKHRHQYLVTRALVRTVLSFYAREVAPADWCFEKNAYGKPSIANPGYESLKFNLSHTDNMIVMAVTVNREIGVDVEWILRSNDVLDICDRFFSPVEVEQLFAEPDEKKRERFFDFWTLKEAYIKARGKGLSIPLDYFSYIFSPSGQITISFSPKHDDHPQGWRFWQIVPNDVHKVALALNDKNENHEYNLILRNIVPQHSINLVNYPLTSHKC